MAKPISSITLTKTQKSALAKIQNAPTPKVAGEDVSTGSKMVTARNLLVRLGLIDYRMGEAFLTDKGREAMRNENIIDDADTLTDIGTELAATEIAEMALLKSVNNSQI